MKPSNLAKLQPLLLPELPVVVDGKNVVHVSVNARSALGRMLAFDALIPFRHPVYGKFNSLAGFYYWLLAGKSEKYDHFRLLNGDLLREVISTVRFRPQGNMLDQLLREGLVCKINQYGPLQRAFKINHLPLAIEASEFARWPEIEQEHFCEPTPLIRMSWYLAEGHSLLDRSWRNRKIVWA